VTVVNPSAAYADGLATGLMVLGPDAGYQLAEREGLAALFIVRTAGDFAGQATPAFDRYSKEQRS
jgi:thiamine biosynthesis lipoprotein